MASSQAKARADSGFTLVELMVVVLILGILISVALPVFSTAQERARTRSCQANLRTIDGAIQQWLADGGGNDLSDLEGSEPFTALVSAAGVAYLKAQPHCVSDGSAYTIESGHAVCNRADGPAHVY